MSWNPQYAVLMAISTIITYLSGLLISKENADTNVKQALFKKKLWVALSFSLNLFILFFFKYSAFALQSIQSVFGVFGIQLHVPAFDIILPVGISFYTFQALSYTMDVYRNEIKAEKNILRYALFVSFFPQLVAGPIERSKNLLIQLKTERKFNYNSARKGLLRMAYGMFQKVVIADRLAVLVTHVFDNYQKYSGFHIVIAIVFFAFQIYCDFGGYSNIAIGSAEILGINLMENFKRPYFATSIKEFWHRWHISLSTWFKDYLYIPLGGSRKGKIRTYINTMIVFLASGLWHGANFTFVVWGGFHGALQIFESIFAPIKNKILNKIKINETGRGFKFFSGVITFMLVCVSWVFFRADSVLQSLVIIKNIFVDFNIWAFWDGSLYTLGLDKYDFNLAVIAIGILIFTDVLREKNIALRSMVLKQNIVLRWAFYYALIFGILVFGYYGYGYNSADFIYFQF